MNAPVTFSLVLCSTLACTLHADIDIFVDDAEGWREAIGEPLTAIDWYPHWLLDGSPPQTSPIPVDYYSDRGVRTGFVDPADPSVINPRPAFDMAYQDPSTPPFFMAGSSSTPDPDGAHLWFSSPVNGIQLSLLESHPRSYGFFPAKFYLNGVLVGETFNIPQIAQVSLGFLTDFEFDHVQAIAAIGHLEFPAISEDSDCGDLNGDGTIDGADLGLFLVAWGDCG